MYTYIYFFILHFYFLPCDAALNFFLKSLQLLLRNQNLVLKRFLPCQVAWAYKPAQEVIPPPYYSEICHYLWFVTGNISVDNSSLQSANEDTRRQSPETSSQSTAFNLKQAPAPVGAYAHARTAGGLLFLAGRWCNYTHFKIYLCNSLHGNLLLVQGWALGHLVLTSFLEDPFVMQKEILWYVHVDMHI